MTDTLDRARPERGAVAADAVRALDRELSARTTKRWLKRLALLGAIGAAVGGAYAFREATGAPPAARFATEKIDGRHLVERIQSTGQVRPLKEVEVGAQVSGRIDRVHVDFNSQVEEGDLLAEIDPRLFSAQVKEIRAQLGAARAERTRAEAKLATARARRDRLQALGASGLASKADLEQAQGAHQVAEAEVAAADAQLARLRAQLDSARTTLRYAEIHSPIDGVVIDRAVDPGQTVASSLEAPVMFVIAQDLKKMQVLADIDEADVGKLSEGMEAEVVVDAFPRDRFEGTIAQIRYSPNELEGVVTYSAVVDVANPDLKLRPGMTATVTVVTGDVQAKAAVPNAALRFRPVQQEGTPGDRFSEALEPGQGRVYVLQGGQPGQERVAERIVDIGLTDGSWTELRGGGLEVGTEVVTEQRDKPEREKILGLF